MLYIHYLSLHITIYPQSTHLYSGLSLTVSAVTSLAGPYWSIIYWSLLVYYLLVSTGLLSTGPYWSIIYWSLLVYYLLVYYQLVYYLLVPTGLLSTGL